MGPDRSQIASSLDKWPWIFSGGGFARRIVPESRPKNKPRFWVRTMWCHWNHFKERSGFPQTNSPCPQNLKSIERALVFYFIIFQKNTGTFESWHNHSIQLKLNSTLSSRLFHSFTSIFHCHHGPYHNFSDKTSGKRRIWSIRGIDSWIMKHFHVNHYSQFSYQNCHL